MAEQSRIKLNSKQRIKQRMAKVGGNPENLLGGGVPGNKGGSGRPPSALRAHMREILEKRGLQKLEDIVSGQEDGVTPSESLKAIDICGKFGLGEAKQVMPDEMAEALAQTLAEFEEIPAEILPKITASLITKLQAL